MLPCERAAFYGHLELLKWAREHNCPWDEDTCERAAFRGHLELLKWARANGCPWDKQRCLETGPNYSVSIYRRAEVRRWVEEH